MPSWDEDDEFAAYGLGPEEIAALRAWALAWVTDLSGRLHDDPVD
ncbi:hypothetical protein [Streptomyces uncialis]